MGRDREHHEQKALFIWARLQRKKFPELDAMYAIPNGGDRNRIVGAKLKAEGVKAGVPDICLPVSRRGYNALYIEMKAPADASGKGKGRVRKNQLEWLERLRSHGNMAVVCLGFDEAKQQIEWYLS